jgi:hypothetical protein
MAESSPTPAKSDWLTARASATPIVPTSEEVWRQVADYDGRYEVSNHGRVRSTYDNRGQASSRRYSTRVLKPQVGQYGYLYVPLVVAPVNGKRRQRKVEVHVAVARAFIGPRPPGMHTAHRDGNPLNCCLENLVYATPQENSHHRLVHGTLPDGPRGESHGAAKLTEAAVREARHLRNTEHHYAQQPRDW